MPRGLSILVKVGAFLCQEDGEEEDEEDDEESDRLPEALASEGSEMAQSFASLDRGPRQPRPSNP